MSLQGGKLVSLQREIGGGNWCRFIFPKLRGNWCRFIFPREIEGKLVSLHISEGKLVSLQKGNWCRVIFPEGKLVSRQSGMGEIGVGRKIGVASYFRAHRKVKRHHILAHRKVKRHHVLIFSLIEKWSDTIFSCGRNVSTPLAGRRATKTLGAFLAEVERVQPVYQRLDPGCQPSRPSADLVAVTGADGTIYAISGLNSDGVSDEVDA